MHIKGGSFQRERDPHVSAHSPAAAWCRSKHLLLEGCSRGRLQEALMVATKGACEIRRAEGRERPAWLP